MTTSKSVKPVFIELFAGVGGFRLALEKAGWAHGWSNQWEPSTKAQHASSCYIRNFGSDNHSCEDIAEVVQRMRSTKEIPVADLLVGGFPCQDYSVAKSLSSARGLEGKKGVLWWEILKIAEYRKPKVILLENVDRLLSSPSGQRGRDFAVMLRTLADLGYFVEWRVINSADYGFPQRRKRVFVFAHKKPLKSFEAHPMGTLINSTFKILSHGPIVEFKLHEDASQISNKFGIGAKQSQFQNWGVFDGKTVFTAKVEPKTKNPSTLGDVLIPTNQVPKEFWVDKYELTQWEFLKGSKSLERTTREGFTYNYSEGKMTYPDALDKPSRTILTGEGGKTPSRFKHIIASGKRMRRLTPVELERLSGFPDDWTKFGDDGIALPDARRAFFIGNALVVGVVERLGKQILKEFF